MVFKLTDFKTYQKVVEFTQNQTGNTEKLEKGWFWNEKLASA